jgi:hypothetical protein
VYVPRQQHDPSAKGRYQPVLDHRASIATQLEGKSRVLRKGDAPAGRTKIPEGGGNPLPDKVRARMEPKLGADLSQVKIHDGGKSAKAATGLGARAFTVGNDVHFNSGEFSPGTKEGDRLLAHELTHVVQGQKSGVQRKPADGEEQVSKEGEPAEQEANTKGDEVADQLHQGKEGDDKKAGDKKTGDKKTEDKKAGDKKTEDKKGEGEEGAQDDTGGEHAGHDHEKPDEKKSEGKEKSDDTKEHADEKKIAAKLDGVGRKIYLEPDPAAAGAEGGAKAEGAEAAGEDEDKPFDVSALSVEGKMEGHAGRIMLKPGDAGGGVTANIVLMSNPPTFEMKPEASISAAHGNNIAGYTTPAYDVKVPRGSSKGVDIQVKMSYNIELADEYTGGRAEVLRDHEMGHVTIGDKSAQKYFVDGVKTELEANAALTPQKVQTALVNGERAFKTNEASDSKSYDSTDYPRMREAYKGVRTSLAELAGQSAPVATVNKAVDIFIDRSVWICGMTKKPTFSDDKLLSGYAQDVISGKAGLGANDLAALQYNAEFKGKVTTATGKIGEYRAKNDKIKPETNDKLDQLAAALQAFTFTPPV